MKCENHWSNFVKRKEQRERENFEPNPANEYVPLTGLPTPISESENILNDKFNIALGNEMTDLISMSRREALKILNVRSNSTREIRIRHMILVRKYHLDKWSEGRMLIKARGKTSSKISQKI